MAFLAPAPVAAAHPRPRLTTVTATAEGHRNVPGEECEVFQEATVEVTGTSTSRARPVTWTLRLSALSENSCSSLPNGVVAEEVLDPGEFTLGRRLGGARLDADVTLVDLPDGRSPSSAHLAVTWRASACGTTTIAVDRTVTPKRTTTTVTRPATILAASGFVLADVLEVGMVQSVSTR
jgi:hypothetical protein